MKTLRRLLCLTLALSMLLSTGILDALALTQDQTHPVQESTGAIADVSDMFVVEEAEAEPQTQEMNVAEKTSETLEPVVMETVNAEPAVTGEAQGFSYTVLENGSCSITGYTGSELENLQIPGSLEGYAVSAIGNNAFEDSGIVSVVLPDSVTSIGNYAFRNCKSLESIELGSGLTYIGAYAFDECAALTSVVLPDTVETMEYGAFRNCVKLASVTYPVNLKKTTSSVWTGIFNGCSALESIVVPEGVTALPNHVFYYAESLKSVTLPSTLTSIGNYAFANSGVKAIDLPDGIKTIGDYAFQNCTALASAELGSSLTYIGVYAFDECAALTSVVLPDTVETMEYGAFRNCVKLASVTYPVNLKKTTSSVWTGIFNGCTTLESIVVPEGVTALPDHVFYYAESLKSVKLPSTLTSIGKHAFDHTAIVSIDLPAGVKSIDNYAFNSCASLESIELGSSLTSIGSLAFAECKSLTALELPNTVATIGNSAFKNCENLASFTYPKNLTEVTAGYQSGIFSGCTALESIEVPEGVTMLPANVFYYAESLKSVTIPSTVTSVGASAFYGCGELTEILLPDTVETIGADAFVNCKKLVKFHYPAKLYSVGNSVWSGIFSGCTALSSIEIPEGATEIPSYTFYYAGSLKSVTVPATVTAVGNYAFQNSGITDIKLPGEVKSVGDSAFLNCKELKTANLGVSLTTIGKNAFQNCYALESIQLGDALQTIGVSAFSGCESLTEIVLPDTVETIDNGAFYNCTNLAGINYPRNLKTVGFGYESGIFTGCTSLESFEVPEGITVLPANLFYYAKSLKSVSLPSTLKTVGSNAFAGTTFAYVDLPDGVNEIDYAAFKNCKELMAVDLGDCLTSIGGNTFEGCDALATINIPETVKNIGNGAFTGCEALVSVDIPESVTTIGGGVFNGCTSLKTVDLPSGLQSMGNGVFQNCTALESVVLCDDLVYVQSNTFYGCSSLRSVHLPRNLKQIQSYAFANCTSLKEVYIPNSVNFIANNAFEGISEMTFQCDLLSYATEFALDHQFAIIPTKIDDKEIASPLNTDNSYYIHNYDALSAAGVMSMAVQYALREDAGVTPKEVTVHVYDFAALQEKTLTLDGEQCKNYTYDDETGRLTIPVTATSGTIRFCLKPKRYEALTSYARLVCQDSQGNETLAIIGSVNSLMPALNISAPGETAKAKVHVTGLAVPETEVSLYLDGVLVKTVKANKVGDYAADISLGEPVEGKNYVITAEAADRSGNLLKAQTDVLYSFKALELLDFVMIYDAHRTQRIDLLEIGDRRPVIAYNPNVPFRFEIDFNNPDVLSDVYVVSTRNHVKKYLKAYWSEELDVFVAEGYFGDDSRYIPGTLSLEYVYGGEKYSFSQGIDFASQEYYDSMPQEWKDADIQLLKQTENETSMGITLGSGENQVHFKLHMETEEIPDYLNEYNAESYGYTKIADDYGEVKFYKEDSTESGEKGSKVTVLDFVAMQITSISNSEISGALGKQSWVTAIEGGAASFSIIASIVSGAFAINDGFTMGKEIEELREKYENNPDVTAEQKKEFNDQVRAAHNINAMSTIVKCACSAATIAGVVVFGPAAPVVAAIGVGSLIIGATMDLIRAVTINDLNAIAEGRSIKLKWVIDPSGYVYDEVTGERLADVTVHAYWVEKTEEDEAFWDDKPGDDEYGVLWDSLEYSQLNPLITDSEGRYAWDVPEGWWRVSYEKEGYESTWSQWLPVPPPQTDVNIGMKPLAAAHTHTEVTIPARAATCTTAGLTEGKKCSECGVILVAQKKILALGHRYDDILDGTCNTCGVHREEVETRKVVHMFRMYNPNTGEHFYTGSTVERDNLIGYGWQYEGVGFTFPANTGAPVHRLFQPSTGEHLYTMDEAEKDKLMAEGWNYEGIAFNSAYNTEAVQHRLHNPNEIVGAYHFTFSQEEKDTLIRLGWEYQGIGWYSCWK